jgi:hypothetical protein
LSGYQQQASAIEPMEGFCSIAAATRYVVGGRQRILEYINYAALNGVESCVRFWNIYADLTVYQRDHVAFDAVAHAAGIKPEDLVGTIVSTAMKHAIDTGNLVAAMMHPEIVRQAGKSAKRIGGKHADIAFRDRLMLLQAQGAVPVPRGQTTAVHVHNTASASAEAAAASKSDASVPTFADDMAAIDGAVMGAHALGPGGRHRQRTLAADTAAGLNGSDLFTPDLETTPVERR